MHDEGRPGGPAVRIEDRQAVEQFDEEDPFGSRRWETAAAAAELCQQILRREPGLNERQLWRALAAYRRIGATGCPTLAGVELASADRQKLVQRLRILIGRLPRKSLGDFSGLVAFTQTFLSRVEFVCDLVVYLFAEREKGIEPEGTEGRRYIEFFVQKLMWELDVVRRIAEQRSLSGLEPEYLDWLVDRILDGEVLL